MVSGEGRERGALQEELFPVRPNSTSSADTTRNDMVDKHRQVTQERLLTQFVWGGAKKRGIMKPTAELSTVSAQVWASVQ